MIFLNVDNFYINDENKLIHYVICLCLTEATSGKKLVKKKYWLFSTLA